MRKPRLNEPPERIERERLRHERTRRSVQGESTREERRRLRTASGRSLTGGYALVAVDERGLVPVLAHHAAAFHRFFGEANVAHLVRAGVGALVSNAQRRVAKGIGRFDFRDANRVLDRLFVTAEPL